MVASGISPYPSALSQPKSVRIATMADAQALYDLCLKLYRDNPLGISISTGKVASIVENLCMGNGGIAGVIDGPHGDLIASVAIVSHQPFFSDEWHLLQLWLFVDPDYRAGGKHAKALFDFVKWHKDHQSRQLGHSVGVDSSFVSLQDQDAKFALWSKWSGGRYVGSSFWVD